MALRASLLAVCCALMVVTLAWHSPQLTYSDPAWQIKALQQYRAGQSPNFNTLVQPDAADLSHDHYLWITHWPILMGLFLWGLTKFGTGILMAVRILAIVGFLVGAAGWGLWASRFELPYWLVYSIAAAVPLIRWGNNALFTYSAEGLAFAFGPWLLVLAEQLASRWSASLALATGVVLGAAYWAKYSLALVSVGALVFLFWRVRWKSLWTVVPCLSLIVALNLLNRIMGGISSLAAEGSLHLNFDWRCLVAPFAFVPLAMADMDSLLHYLLLSPGHPIAHAEMVIYLLAIPGGLLLAFLLRPKRNAEWAGVTVAVVSMASLGALWLTGRSVSFEARHIAVASVGLIPVAAAECWRRWPTASRVTRLTMAVTAVAYLGLPITYGAATVIGKRNRVSAPQIASLPSADILYLPTPVTALEATSREIITHADFESASMLKSRSYRTSVPMRVAALLPLHFEGDGKADIIRNSFPQARGWTLLGSSGIYQVWVAELSPQPQKSLP